jgi:hypothetical protein
MSADGTIQNLLRNANDAEQITGAPMRVSQGFDAAAPAFWFSEFERVRFRKSLFPPSGVSGAAGSP